MGGRGERETPRSKRTKELMVNYMDEGDEDDPDSVSCGSNDYNNNDEDQGVGGEQ